MAQDQTMTTIDCEAAWEIGRRAPNTTASELLAMMVHVKTCTVCQDNLRAAKNAANTDEFDAKSKEIQAATDPLISQAEDDPECDVLFDRLTELYGEEIRRELGGA